MIVKGDPVDSRTRVNKRNGIGNVMYIAYYSILKNFFRITSDNKKCVILMRPPHKGLSYVHFFSFFFQMANQLPSTVLDTYEHPPLGMDGNDEGWCQYHWNQGCIPRHPCWKPRVARMPTLLSLQHRRLSLTVYVAINEDKVGMMWG